MKRVWAGLTFIVFIAGAPASGAAPVALERNAFAMWAVGRSGADASRTVGVSLWTTRSPDEIEEVARFAIFEGVCFDGSDTDSCLVSTSGHLSGTARPGEFSIDEATGSAHLKVTRRGKTTEINWEGLMEAEPGAHEVYCGEMDSGMQATLQRAATATGTVKGRRMPADPAFHAAEITTGAQACPNGDDLDALLSGETLDLTIH
jgi:hypothetical protein